MPLEHVLLCQHFVDAYERAFLPIHAAHPHPGMQNTLMYPPAP